MDPWSRAEISNFFLQRADDTVNNFGFEGHEASVEKTHICSRLIKAHLGNM